MANIDDRGVDLNELRARLGRVGVWLSAIGTLPAARERDLVAQIEALGYPTLWVTESHKEAFAHAAFVLAASQRLTVATGIANVWAREPETTVAGANTLGEAFDGRFVLGIGIGHASFVPRYDKPLSTMRNYLDRMHAASYAGPAPARPVPWLVAALRPGMLELARTRAQGSHPYFVPVEHTARTRDALGPDAVLAPEITVVLDADPDTARATARRFMQLYLGLANYTGNLRTLGFTESDLAGGGSDRLVDAIVAWGDTEAIQARVQAHLDAGADHVCIQPIDYSNDTPIEALTRLAPALLRQ
ncbi:MAG: LLM class F420-dependent oxidoreductase [Pseudonocardiales bacterium]|nr:MAG: LLM class F420-dependent oxidoreductase [Pseudonocardiales bacterium]